MTKKYLITLVHNLYAVSMNYLLYSHKSISNRKSEYFRGNFIPNLMVKNITRKIGSKILSKSDFINNEYKFDINNDNDITLCTIDSYIDEVKIKMIDKKVG